MDQDKIVSALSEISGEDNVSTSLFTRINSALDGLPYDLEKEQIPFAVVRPKDTEEISRILKLANTEKFPVVIRGAGTGIHGGTRPKRGGVVLDTTRLDSVEILEEYGYCEAGAGVYCSPLNDKLSDMGYYFPVLPGSERVATIGAVVSINMSGHSVDAYQGKPENYVLGLEVVLPTGEVLWTGSKTLRKPAGPDLTRLFIGTEGLLGVITKVRFRLVPLPKYFKRVFIVFGTIYEAAECTVDMYLKKAPYPFSLEIMSENCAKPAFEAVGLPDPGGAVYLLVVDGRYEDEVGHKVERMLEIVREHKPEKIEVIEDEARWGRIWYARQQILPVLCSKGPSIAEICDPSLANLPDAIREVEEIPKRLGTIRNLDVYIYGHIGAPSFHPHFILPTGLPADVKREAIREIRAKIAEVNLKLGCSYGEQGIFPERKEFFLKKYGDKAYELLLELKRVFDPNDILNPGNL
ncbi:MAG: FAD-binding oxidoreductase [Candidatus Bathyarchaeia archaeon]